VSKERARRRAEREAAGRLTAARAARRARWNVLARLRRARPPASPRPARPAKVASAIGRHRARQNGVLLAALVAVNAVYWLVQPSWSWRLGALVATALAWPMLVVVLFDRRSSR
jgi:Flp pilus assembly protein TadB